jgi:hypothetical protein
MTVLSANDNDRLPTALFFEAHFSLFTMLTLTMTAGPTQYQ